jgi:hypothetical protein
VLGAVSACCVAAVAGYGVVGFREAFDDVAVAAPYLVRSLV